jgi:tetratricopeptide (TPR) repeat protein
VTTRILRLVVILVAGVLPATASADEARDARMLYEKGMAHYRLQEYEQAIEKWQAAFRLRPAPQFLYDLGQAYRLSKQWDKALHYYRNYLSMYPTAPNRGDVERQITTLEELVASGETDKKMEPVKPPAPDKPVPPQIVVAPPAVAPAGDQSAPRPALAPLPPSRKPLYKKGWF